MTRQHYDVPTSMLQCCKQFNSLACANSGSAYRMEDINFNVHCKLFIHSFIHIPSDPYKVEKQPKDKEIVKYLRHILLINQATVKKQIYSYIRFTSVIKGLILKVKTLSI
jgi:hypothetical protein